MYDKLVSHGTINVVIELTTSLNEICEDPINSESKNKKHRATESQTILSLFLVVLLYIIKSKSVFFSAFVVMYVFHESR